MKDHGTLLIGDPLMPSRKGADGASPAIPPVNRRQSVGELTGPDLTDSPQPHSPPRDKVVTTAWSDNGNALAALTERNCIHLFYCTWSEATLPNQRELADEERGEGERKRGGGFRGETAQGGGVGVKEEVLEGPQMIIGTTQSDGTATPLSQDGSYSNTLEDEDSNILSEESPKATHKKTTQECCPSGFATFESTLFGVWPRLCARVASRHFVRAPSWCCHCG
eukprot:GHVT01041430.1.p1 GENE.GHVT01041430.1~~GHVT01041430.1.p1  ORF type:complete len:223 (-),score=22.49 GHVT01041430.1:1841-2509(-)